MSVLSDATLRAYLEAGRLLVDPLADGAVQPSSIDLRLGDTMLVRETGAVDLEEDQTDQYVPSIENSRGCWLLFPNRLYLATTMEWIGIPRDLVGHLHGRSTLARAGIVCHQQAGLLDPGYGGRPTIELTVVYPTYLRAGQPIAQLELLRLTTPVERPYDGRYQHNSAPQPPRLLETS